MQYNLHVIIVHFPVALLTVYSVIKIFPFKKFFPRVAWRDIERVLLVFGVLGAFAALYTGDMAKHIVKPERDLLNAHVTFAIITTCLYGVLLLGELFAIFNPKIPNLKMSWLTSLGICIEKIFCNPIFSGLLAFVALISITITGLLGGVMAFGLTADPMTPLVLKMLGISF